MELNMKTDIIKFSELPDKLLGLPDSHISEAFFGKCFNEINIGDVIEYNGIPRWNRLQEVEIEKRISELNCEYLTWYENNKVWIKFIDKK
jgi:hypothetical protein